MAEAAEMQDWPFFEPRHCDFAGRLAAWAETAVPDDAPEPAGEAALDATCRRLVAALGAGGWLDAVVPIVDGAAERSADGATPLGIDARTLCLARAILARRDALADFAFAMQGLGAAPVTLFGSAAQRARFLPAVRAGRCIAAFALSEPGAGSDVAAIATTARRDGTDWVLDGTKSWISNAGLAGLYCVFARTEEGPRGAGLSCFIVTPEDTGFHVAERVAVSAPHPLGTLAFSRCRLPADRLVGRPGDGMRIALSVLDLFRPSVGAAALGFGRRALALALDQARGRHLFGGSLGDLQQTQARLADIATALDAAALLVCRAAWAQDRGRGRATREAAMAKLAATEAAQLAADGAVQLLGARGLVAGSPAERLYREVRALRIYEGASEVQKVIIARQLVAAAPASRP